MTSDQRGPEWPIEPEQHRPAAAPAGAARAAADPGPVKRRERGLSPLLLALGGLVVLLLALWLFSAGRDPDQDKLSDDQLATAQPASAEKLCASKATYDLIKRELFRRAAQLRGSDHAAFDRLSAYATLRVENPVMESEDSRSGAVSCSASVALDLPPGVAVVGGRRTLSTELDYSVQPAADGSGRVVLLRNPEAIVTPLATLARVSAPQPQSGPQPEPQANDSAPEIPATPAEPAAQPPPAEPARPAGARPSFDCDRARTRGEIAVCANANLAALDRQMAAQYGRAIAVASPAQRRLLQQTRDRFLGYRDRCANTACIGDAYTGRMREISDIMAGRWQPPR